MHLSAIPVDKAITPFFNIEEDLGSDFLLFELDAATRDSPLLLLLVVLLLLFEVVTISLSSGMSLSSSSAPSPRSAAIVSSTSPCK